MSRRYVYYWGQFVCGALALAGLVLAMIWLGNSWFQLIVAGLIGCVLSQFGFLGHDAAHRQIFKSAAWNEWTARLVSGAVLGLSYGWWRGKHNSHHAAPNQVGRDPDISSGLLAMTQEIAGRTHRAGAVAHPATGLAAVPAADPRGAEPARGRAAAACSRRGTRTERWR